MRTLTTIAILAFGSWASAQELWTFGKPNLVYGVYRKVVDTDNTLNYHEVRIGHIDAKRTQSTYEGKPCILFSTTAFFSPKPIAKNIVPPPTVRRYDVWMTPEGAPLRVYMQHTGFGKAITTDAKFKGDEIELSTTQGGKTTKSLLNPSEGVKSFTNPFMDMMAKADKDRQTVTFCCLEAFTGGICKYKARVVGKFTQRISDQLTFAGRMIEVEGPGKEQTYTLYVSNEGQLLQVDLPDGSYVVAQDFPLLPETGKSKGGGR